MLLTVVSQTVKSSNSSEVLAVSPTHELVRISTLLPRLIMPDGRAIREANAIALDACTPMQDSSMQCLAQRYAEFCTMVKIPRLPISQSTLALFHVAKCSHRDGYYQSTVRMMRRMIDEGESMWRNERGYADLNGPRAWVATREFMAERSHLRLRGASTAQSESPKPGLPFHTGPLPRESL